MTDELVLFVESAYKLEISPFWAWATNPGQNPDMERICAGDWLAHEGLSREALDSFCLTLRLLIQNSDGFSLRQVGQMTESWPESSAVYRDAIRHARDELECRLNEPSMVTIPEQAQNTNGQLFDVIFYGGLVHMNPSKRAVFRHMTNAGLFSFFVFRAFVATLFHYRNCIQTVAYNIVQHLETQKRAVQDGHEQGHCPNDSFVRFG